MRGDRPIVYIALSGLEDAWYGGDSGLVSVAIHT